MKLPHTGIAGTMESGDMYVEVEPGTPGEIQVELDSAVTSQFGGQIRRTIQQTLTDCGVDGARVKAVDKGALDCTIRARVTAAAYRGADEQTVLWR